MISGVALLRSIRSGMNPPDSPPLAEASGVSGTPEFVPPAPLGENLNDVLRQPPTDRPPPEAVNEFLREEQGVNSSRLDLLQQRDVAVSPIDFAARCLPKWDFRQAKREVIWFYHYRSGRLPSGRNLIVFGAVDGMGHPLFQHPPMAGDPLALLDSQYEGLRWIALESPRLALIAASNGPWPRSGAIVDLFLLNDPADPSAPRFWRFDDASYAEQPARSARLIGFHDGNGDDLLDLCVFWFSGEGENGIATGRWHPFDEARGAFEAEGIALPETVLQTMRGDYQRLAQEEPIAQPFFIALPSTEPVFPAKVEEPASGEDSGESSEVEGESAS